MVRSQTGDVDLSRSVDAANAIQSDRPVSFRFVVTLKCLAIPLDSGQASPEVPQASALVERPRASSLAVAAFAPPEPPAISVVVSAPSLAPPPALAEPSPSPAPSAAPLEVATAHGTTDFMPAASVPSSPSALPWELAAPQFRLDAVVPTVLRAFKKTTTEVAAGSPPPAPPQPSLPPPVPVQVAPVETPAVDAEHVLGLARVPKLYTAAPVPARFWKTGAAALAAVVILILVWRLASRPARHEDRPVQPKAQSTAQSTTNDGQTSMQNGDWVRQAAVGGDPGVKQSRQLVLYKPGMSATNGRIEFAWSPDSGDVGLVFRAKDLGNYYGVRMKVMNPHTAPTLDIEYFSVYQFNESPHREKFLVLPKADSTLRVRLDIVGPAFTLYLQDNATEFWTDARLTSGGLGFLEEWNRAPQVNAVRISLGQKSRLFSRPPAQALEFLARNEPPVLAREKSDALGGS